MSANASKEELRYNCLELAHRIKPGSADITAEAQKFIDFVEGNNGARAEQPRRERDQPQTEKEAA